MDNHTFHVLADARDAICRLADGTSESVILNRIDAVIANHMEESGDCWDNHIVKE